MKEASLQVAQLAWSLEGVSGGGERAVSALHEAASQVVSSTLVMVGKGEADQVRALCGSFDNPLPRPLGLWRALRQAQIIHVHQLNTFNLDLAQLLRSRKQRVVVTDYGGAGLSVSRILSAWPRVDAVMIYASDATIPEKLKKRVKCVPLPIDVDRFSPGGCFEAEEGSVLCVGRVLPHKGFDHAIRALPVGARLTILGSVGDDKYLEYLRRLSVGKDVVFVFGADDAELVSAFRRAAVVVVPSVAIDCFGKRHRAPELFGLVAGEAAACGKPVIVSDEVPALRREIRRGEVEGAVYPSLDEGRLHDLICLFTSARLSLRNREYMVSLHSREVVAMRIHEFYEDVLSCSGLPL